MLFLRKKLFTLLTWATAISLLNTGCIAFHPESAERDKDGHYIDHFWSCGPTAIYKSLWSFDPRGSREQISKEIQSTGNFTRTLLLFVHHEFVSATFPCEIKQYYQSHNLKVKEVDGLSQLKSGDVAIVLIRGNLSKGQVYHWLCYPADERIESFYGEDTKIVKIYLISQQ